MAKILIISNGHGEDLSGSLIAKQLKKLNYEVDALPIVGKGNIYKKNYITILGNTKQFSTGGIGYTSLSGRLAEIIQGQIFYLLRRLFLLLKVSKEYDLIVAVGDVVPVIGAWLTGVPAVVYLVAYSSHYEGKISLPWPCSQCLLDKRFLQIYTRDYLTADDLTRQLGVNVSFLGNPFMDPVLSPRYELPKVLHRLGLIPGSRRPELDSNISLILEVIALLPISFFENNEISLDMALVAEVDDHSMNTIAELKGWKLDKTSPSLSKLYLLDGPIIINIHRDSFVEVIQSSDVLLCMAGTAAEQAVGLAKPIVQLKGFGPQYTPAFAEAQRRLLGPTVFCANGSPGNKINLKATSDLIIDLLLRCKTDVKLLRECESQADLRLGTAGGGKQIANSISNIIESNLLV